MPRSRARPAPTAASGRNHRHTQSRGAPGGDVARGPGLPEIRRAVPDGELPDVRVQVTRAQKGEAHRQLAAVAIEGVVGHERVLRRVDHAEGGAEAAIEALDPARAGRGDRALDERVAREGEDDVQLRSVLEQALGPQDVRAAGQRAVRVARRVAVQFRLDALGDLPLGPCRESPGHPGGRDPMAAEVRDPGAGEDAEDLGSLPVSAQTRRNCRRVVASDA